MTGERPVGRPSSSVRIIGDGRAGGSFATALAAAGWTVDVWDRRSGDPVEAAAGVDLVLICVPDGAVRQVAASIRVVPTTVVAHCAGSLRLDVLEPHPRRASVHPIVSLPDPVIGAERLRGAWFGTSGDPLALQVVESLGGRPVQVDESDRVAYHAAAVIASNHLVALMGQVERIAEGVGVPLDAYLELAAETLRNVAALGPAAALTGPVARGDWATVSAHVEALDPEERPAYEALADQAARLRPRADG